MSKSKTGHAVLLEGKVYERRPDGSLVPMKGESDHARLDAMIAAEVEATAAADRDGAPMNDTDWARGEIAHPTKIAVGIKLDDDVLAWFKARGKGYQTRINAVLRRYVEAQRKAG